jgi:spore coat polysaccharide biosynthesis protein SpsF
MERIAVIQARMNSSRLPGKVLMPLGGKPAIQHIIERVQKSIVDHVVVATTNSENDIPLVNFCLNFCDVYCGSENDVISRTYGASCWNDSIIDITGDCPLVDPTHIDEMIQHFEKYNLDYISNTMTRSWPDGFDIQIYKREIYQKIHDHVKNENHRHHSGWNIIHYSNIFSGLKVMNIPAPDDCYYPEWGLTLDDERDLKVLDIIFSYFKDNTFSAKDVIDYIKANQYILDINSDVKRNLPGRG